ncbi:hypothetical protein [Cognaticolwellia mytili]|uniref:hypothetical protein n=1 Tax=Cognaticolwellia mytili TaxID=1888913 RepID=UPI00146C317D|nr:hypothetical protein [Cognaticolwellia mytili]
MFSQLFIFLIGISSLFMGFQDGDYIWAFCGLVMILSSVHLLYKLKKDKNIWDK